MGPPRAPVAGLDGSYLSVHLPPVKTRFTRRQAGNRGTGKGSGQRAPGAVAKAPGKGPPAKGKDKAGKGGKDKGKAKDQHKG